MAIALIRITFQELQRGMALLGLWPRVAAMQDLRVSL